jgi:ABC-type branched-subunit amino acid transport system substrate-binding protein
MSELTQLEKSRLSRRRFLKSAGAAAGVLSLSRLGLFAQQATFIQIGALLPLTGGLSDLGPRFQAAGQLAIDDMNAVGIPGNFRLGLVVRDDATSDKLTATAAALQLISAGVPGIFGPAASSNVVAVNNVTAPNKVPVFSPSSTAHGVRTLPDSSYIFRTTPSDDLQSIVLAEVAAKRGYKKIAIIARNEPYGQGLAQSLTSNFKALGGSVTSTSLYALDATDFSAQIAEAKAGSPDAISLITFQEAEPLIKQLEAAGVHNWDLLVDGNKIQDMFNRIAKAIGVAPLVGKMGTGPSPAKTAGVDAFTAQYQAALKESPVVYTPNCYDAIAAMGLTIAKVVLSNGGKAPTGADIQGHVRDVCNPATPPDPNEVTVTVAQFDKAFSTLSKGGKIKYAGAGSDMTFAPNNDVVAPIGTWYIDKNGQIQDLESVACGASSCADVTKLPPSS